MAEASYPEDLKYHAEHDWARIEGDQATFGDHLVRAGRAREVVFFDPPEVGASVSKDDAYAEVESVKAVSDVFAPLSGRDRRGERGARRQPREGQRGPLREGWMVKGEALDPSEVDQLMDVAAYKELLRRVANVVEAHEPLHGVTNEDLRDARRHRRRLAGGPVRGHP